MTTKKDVSAVKGIPRNDSILLEEWPWSWRKRRDDEYGALRKIDGPHGITLDAMEGTTNYQVERLVELLNAVEKATRPTK